MRILSIETSCDETAVALLEITGSAERPEITILGNTLYSQAHLHAEFGGVYPMLAKREHTKNLPPLLSKTLTEAGENEENPNLDFIAVTSGPGLEPALWTGIEFAEKLGHKWGKPVLPVNHMEGHIFSVLPSATEGIELPALALLISGGHTELVYIKSARSYEILGRTLDDAAGEAYDKVARMLGLSYPGGPKISRLAEISREKHPLSPITFPRPMIHAKNLDFSFSGLKTAVLYFVKEAKREDEDFKEEVARAFDDAVMDVLVSKTRQALLSHDAKTLIIAGGVAAAASVQKRFNTLKEEFPEISLKLPGQGLATDNAVMIGLAAFVHVSQDPEVLMKPQTLEARGNLSFDSERVTNQG